MVICKSYESNRCIVHRRTCIADNIRHRVNSRNEKSFQLHSLPSFLLALTCPGAVSQPQKEAERADSRKTTVNKKAKSLRGETGKEPPDEKLHSPPLRAIYLPKQSMRRDMNGAIEILFIPTSLHFDFASKSTYFATQRLQLVI